MVKKASRIEVRVFPRPVPKGADACCLNEGGCGGGCCGSADNLEDVLFQIQRENSDKVDIIMANYDTDEPFDGILKALNNILKRSDEDFQVTEENFESFMAHAAPLIAVDGKLVSSGMVPSKNRLLRTIGIEPKNQDNLDGQLDRGRCS